MTSLRTLESNKLSHFRTSHKFALYGEFRTVDEYLELKSQVLANNHELIILANGSNVLFSRKRIRTAVLKNRLPRKLTTLDEGRIEASSSTPVSVILKYCRDRKLDSFYYLASVPATVGGSIAMNAGRGSKFGGTILDFVESVTYLDGTEAVTLSAPEIDREYRWTKFAGIQDKLILSAVFCFPPAEIDEDQIAARIEYSRTEQDLSSPNCGSVFKIRSMRILRYLLGLRIGGARYSPKTVNWILNRGNNAGPILVLIWIASIAHRVLGRRAVLELIKVS